MIFWFLLIHKRRAILISSPHYTWQDLKFLRFINFLKVPTSLKLVAFRITTNVSAVSNTSSDKTYKLVNTVIYVGSGRVIARANTLRRRYRSPVAKEEPNLMNQPARSWLIQQIYA